MASVFIRERRGQFKHRDTKTHREGGQERMGRDWREAVASQAVGATRGSEQVKRFLPQSPPRQPGLADSVMSESSLENCKGMKCLLF